MYVYVCDIYVYMHYVHSASHVPRPSSLVTFRYQSILRVVQTGRGTWSGIGYRLGYDLVSMLVSPLPQALLMRNTLIETSTSILVLVSLDSGFKIC